MIADLLPQKQRAEGFSITRVSMNLGVVLGPARPVSRSGWGVSFRQLFLSAAGGCVIIARDRRRVGRVKSRPASAVETGRSTDVAGRTGYRIVLADRRFLIFCAVAVPPGLLHRQLRLDLLGVHHRRTSTCPYGTWGWLLAMNALIVAAVQYPLVRVLKWRNRMMLLAVSSALLGVGIGGSAFAGALSTLVVLVMVMSLGEVLLSPVASAEVSDFAPEAVRGRYMGVWTVVWSGGAALGPAFGGWAMDAIGARKPSSCSCWSASPARGAFALLAPSWRRRHRTRGRRRPEPGGAAAAVRACQRPAPPATIAVSAAALSSASFGPRASASARIARTRSLASSASVRPRDRQRLDAQARRDLWLEDLAGAQPARGLLLAQVASLKPTRSITSAMIVAGETSAPRRRG